ncbi:MAG: DUF4147 domain-containing protein [Gluconacetobacter diazotrophicus]|nr:DUF4147 domain-containing protein [Gluconacetobacter diazotrophicus]
MTDAEARALLRDAFDAAVRAALPGAVLARHLPAKPAGRCLVIGAGKAAASMAAALEEAWPDVMMEGVVVTRRGHGVATRRIEVVEASHPVPDAAGEAAARRILALAREARAGDLVIALISGGGSALLSLPADGITLADKQAVTTALLRSGAPIGAMNRVRGALSAIKDGRLARAAAPATLHTLLISDVPGDDPRVIASGPTIPPPADRPDPRTEAAAILRRHGVEPPPAVAAVLAAAEAPAAADGYAAGEVRMIASPLASLLAAAAVARARGVTPVILGDAIEGEAREAGIVMAGIARSVRAHGLPAAAPALLISGGETTVTLGSAEAEAASGGRNTEFLLSAAVALDGLAGMWGIAGDTDGIDGTGEAAGAVFGPDSAARAAAAGASFAAMLAEHRSRDAFAATGDLLVTGPTFTNVNDFRAILVG